MPKFIKKPIEIEAIQWTGINLEEIKSFVGTPLIYEIFDGAWQAGMAPPRIEMKIKTLEGEMQVSLGDYIIKGVNGEFYPCKSDIFAMTYEAKNEIIASVNEAEQLKKEIERLTKILENYALQYGTVKDQQKVIEKAKQEVAKEIIDVLIKTVDDNEFPCDTHDRIMWVVNSDFLTKFINDAKKKHIGE